MHQLLHNHTTRSAVILHGLGGMVKTQLVILYTRQHVEQYKAIFSPNSNDENSLRVNLDEDLERVFSAVVAWLNLQKNTRWLMIYDNQDNPKTSSNPDLLAGDIHQFTPRCDHGSIITQRHTSHKSAIVVASMSRIGNLSSSPGKADVACTAACTRGRYKNSIKSGTIPWQGWP